MKIATIVGARPQFVKAAPVSRALKAAGIREFLLHTGQHYDERMSAIFFRELGISEPDVNLGVGSTSPGRQTGEMLIGIERKLAAEAPDVVLVYGDTNSTLAGALAAAKLNIPLCHVEAGLRSFNRTMPEEYNRVVTDHCSTILFCPTDTAVRNLKHEGILRGVHQIGDTMCDAIEQFLEIARRRPSIIKFLGLSPKSYIVATVHRPYNTDVPENMASILQALQTLETTVLFPVHPRARLRIDSLPAHQSKGHNIRLIEPLGYLDMLVLQENAQVVLTDSGGMQKEAYLLGVPCVTLRPETEWRETVESGWNVLAGAGGSGLREALAALSPKGPRPPLFGDGHAAERITAVLVADFGQHQTNRGRHLVM